MEGVLVDALRREGPSDGNVGEAGELGSVAIVRAVGARARWRSTICIVDGLRRVCSPSMTASTPVPSSPSSPITAGGSSSSPGLQISLSIRCSSALRRRSGCRAKKPSSRLATSGLVRHSRTRLRHTGHECRAGGEQAALGVVRENHFFAQLPQLV